MGPVKCVPDVNLTFGAHFIQSPARLHLVVNGKW